MHLNQPVTVATIQRKIAAARTRGQFLNAVRAARNLDGSAQLKLVDTILDWHSRTGIGALGTF